MASVASGVVVLAFVLDLTIGELPTRIHPVAAYGRVIDSVETVPLSAAKKGLLIAGLLPLIAALAVSLIVVGAWRVDPWVGGAVAGLALFTTTSLRMLIEEALSVIDLSATDIEAARDNLKALAGRSPDSLSAVELRSAAVESAAENLADGLVGPLLGFLVGSVASLPMGVALAVWIKAVNTGDSMVGYPSNPIGSASARLDDFVQWVPARVTAVVLAVVSGRPFAVRSAKRWARTPSSPNSGWPMATLAAVLDVQLSKPGVYRLNPGADLPSVEVAKSGVYRVGVAGVTAFAIVGVVSWF